MKIAIDGFAGSGKSTIAKKISEEFNLLYIDTGAMYRMITLFYIENNIDLNTDLSYTELEKLNLDMTQDKFYLNSEDVTLKIRQDIVSDNVSKVASLKNVRSIMVKKQRELSKNRDVILDGRDIGSVVFPDAKVKIFLTASPEIRAKRRVLQLKELKQVADYDKILQNIKDRDYIDSTRKISPLIKVDEAIEIDSTSLTKDEVYKKIKEIISKCITK